MLQLVSDLCCTDVIVLTVLGILYCPPTQRQAAGGPQDEQLCNCFDGRKVQFVTGICIDMCILSPCQMVVSSFVLCFVFCICGNDKLENMYNAYVQCL